LHRREPEEKEANAMRGGFRQREMKGEKRSGKDDQSDGQRQPARKKIEPLGKGRG
jgi:hypothetical protein